MPAYRPITRSYRAICAILTFFLAHFWITGTLAAEPRVLIMRGWFNVFSTGMDTLAGKLKDRGINAEVAGHYHWDTALNEILRERAAGNTAPIVLIGHSQGANNAVVLAHSLNAHRVPVDLLITVAPFLQHAIPGNVARAINYYQSPGWGTPIVPEPGFQGRLTNVDLASDLTIFHITIDKSSKVQEAIVREVADVQARPFIPDKPMAARPHTPRGPLSYAPATR